MASRSVKTLTRLCCLLALLIAHAVIAAEKPESSPAGKVHDNTFCSPDGIALGGYDVVAYHTLNKAVPGGSEFSVEHQGLTYQFSSEEHLQLFIAAPEKYLPHFRGWCAIALTQNRLICPDYTNFKIEDGQLLLFETIAFVNGRSVWDSDASQNRSFAEQNFRRFLQE